MQVPDYTVGANPTGFNMRTELNNIVEALVTNNSGASEPPATFEGMVWYDTTTKNTYRRNDSGGWDKMITEQDAITLALVFG